MKSEVIKQLPDWFDGEAYDEGDEVSDPYTGETCLLDAAELSMYDLVKGAEMGLSMELNVDVQQCKDIIQNGKAWFKTKNLDAYIKLLSDGDEGHGTSDQGPSKLIL